MQASLTRWFWQVSIAQLSLLAATGRRYAA